MESKRVGIYARVSTANQTTENQLLDLRSYCKARNWQIVAEHVDEGISGTKDNRPQLKAIMALARKREIDVLLVWRFDRFARSLAHLVNSLAELRSLNVGFASYQEAIDTSTPQGRMVFGVMASLAEFERELIRERVLSGLRRLKASGAKLGRPGIGDDKENEVRSLAKLGLSGREIAARTGVSKSAVQRLVTQKPYGNGVSNHAVILA